MSKKTISLNKSLLTKTALKALEYNEIMKSDAEHRVLTKFPERIVYLNELLKKPEFNICSQDVDFTLEVPPITKADICSKEINGKKNSKKQREVDEPLVPVKESLTMPSNKHNAELIKILKPIIKQLLEDANSLKIWVILLVPIIQDGNNYGVSVQEDAVAEIYQVECEATRFLEQISRYYVTRAKYTTKVIKYPFSEDYRRCVEELDDKQRMVISFTMHEIRNRYAALHDLVIKNFEKIVEPRNSNVESLY